MARRWSKLVTIAAGVLGALVCYGVITYCVVDGGLVSDDAKSLQATRMNSANVGAFAAAAAVGTFPSNRHAPFFEPFITWATASMILPVILAPGHPLIHRAARAGGAVAAFVASRGSSADILSMPATPDDTPVRRGRQANALFCRSKTVVSGL